MTFRSLFYPWQAYCPCADCPRAPTRPFRGESWEALYAQLAWHALQVDNESDFWDAQVKARLRARSGPAQDADEAVPAHEGPPPPDTTMPPRRKRKVRDLEARLDNAMKIVEALETDVIDAVLCAKAKLRQNERQSS